MAAFEGDEDHVQWLLGHGADIDAAAALGKGAHLDSVNTQELTVLMLAAHAGQVDAVRLLLDAGADTKAVNIRKSTALLFAAQEGSISTIELLLDKLILRLSMYQLTPR